MPDINKGSTVTEFCLETFLPYRLVVVVDGMVRVFAENFNETYSLTVPEWRVLVVVGKHGSISPTNVGLRTAMDKVKVSRAAQSLLTKGLIRQRRDPGDGRGRLLRLTRKGTATHVGIVPLATKLEAALFDDLSQAEMAALHRVLEKIGTRVEMNGPAGGAAAE
jgi:DNA-binding MarR family transcriptional regulator